MKMACPVSLQVAVIHNNGVNFDDKKASKLS